MRKKCPIIRQVRRISTALQQMKLIQIKKQQKGMKDYINAMKIKLIKYRIVNE